MQKIPIIILFFFLTEMKAQTVISLENAIETALKNNLHIKNTKLKADYQNLLIKTAKNIPATNFSTGFGQMNSAYFDHHLGISQSFLLPKVYEKQKQLLSAEAKAATLQIAVKEADLKRAVTEIFYTFLYLNEKEKLLLRSDTIFNEFLKKATLRLEKGESNLLEKTSAETQHDNLILQLREVAQAKELLQIQFQLLLNSETPFFVKSNVFKQSTSKLSVFQAEKHPILQILEQEKQVSVANSALEKTKLLPEFSVGYSNATIRGTGANDVKYNGITRFHSAQIGVNIPLFKASQKAKIDAVSFYEKVADNDFLIEKTHLEKQYQTAQLQLENAEKNVLFFEEKALKNVQLIEKTANKQFQNGEINYLEWAMLINQSISVKSAYLDAIKAVNDAVVEVDYLVK